MKYGLFSFLIAVLVTVSCSFASAQTLLVSDVDDTIKLAHVQNYKDMIYYAFDDSSRFMGMSDLYNLIVQDNPDMQVVYLSRAPTWIMKKRHLSLLKKGAFPEGRYIGRENLSRSTHKVEALRGVIEEFKPKKVILIGDNGEADPAVYAQIAEEYRASGIQFFQFIRIVYSKSLYTPVKPATLISSQTGFVTPVEISLELESQGLLHKTSVEKLLATKGADLSNPDLKERNGEYAFPYFVDCSSFQWRWDARLAEFAALPALRTRIFQRCGLTP